MDSKIKLRKSLNPEKSQYDKTLSTDTDVFLEQPELALEENNNPNILNENEELSASAGRLSPSMVNYDSGLLRRPAATPRYRKNADVNARRRHWSAPDLSFGGSIDVSLLKSRCENADGRDITDKLQSFIREKSPSRYTTVRRASIDTTLEHIAEDEENEEEENHNQSMAEGGCMATNPHILPPIYEQNSGYQNSSLARKNFFSHTRPSSVQATPTTTSNYRYIKSRIDTRQRKMSM